MAALPGPRPRGIAKGGPLRSSSLVRLAPVFPFTYIQLLFGLIWRRDAAVRCRVPGRYGRRRPSRTFYLGYAARTPRAAGRARARDPGSSARRGDRCDRAGGADRDAQSARRASRSRPPAERLIPAGSGRRHRLLRPACPGTPFAGAGHRGAVLERRRRCCRYVDRRIPTRPVPLRQRSQELLPGTWSPPMKGRLRTFSLVASSARR